MKTPVIVWVLKENFGNDPPIGSNKIKLQEKVYLNLGIGDAWAGHCKEIDKLCSLVIPVIVSVAKENFGADPPIGSSKR